MNSRPTPYTQPRSRKFVLGLGAIMCGLVIYWGGFFSNITLQRIIPTSIIILGLVLVAPRVGAFITWSLQKKR